MKTESKTVTKIVLVPGREITDWESFHAVFQKIFGFPDFYGANMNAWIDCMTDLDNPEGGMVQIAVATGELVAIRLRTSGAAARKSSKR